MYQMLLNACSLGCAGVRSSAARGRGVEQSGGAPGLYDAPPLGMLSSCFHAMHMLLHMLLLAYLTLCWRVVPNSTPSSHRISLFGQLRLMTSYT